MNTIELRLRKKTTVPFAVLAILALTVGIYTVFVKDGYSLYVKAIGIVVFMYTLYWLYITIKKLLKNVPIITLNDEAIILNEENVSIPKSEIQNIDVIYIDDTGYFLSIKTDKKNYETNVSWIDKTPEQIKELIKRYN